MLSKKQIVEVREHLEKAQNPAFLYDNDADGFCSFLLLRRWLGRGTGMAIRSYPDLDVSYVKRIEQAGADYVFVLDKPVISDTFIEGIHNLGLPFVWIDHHDMPLPKMYENMHVYNPARNKGKQKSGEPVTYLCYAITQRKEDLWLAVAGCVADHYLPKFAKEFGKQNPELWGNVKEPFDAYFRTEIGKIAQAFNFGVKDKALNIESMQEYVFSCRNADDVLAENDKNSGFRDHVLNLKHKFDKLVEEAQRCVVGNVLFFSYGGEVSMSSEVSNALSYYNPKKYIAVVFRKGGVANISLRGEGVKSILEKILPQIEHATGGGHENAVGARVPIGEVDKFKELLFEEINKD